MKKILITLAVAIGIFTLSACGTASTPDIGISMPTTSSTRWISDGYSMKEQFEELGYEVILEYAQDNITNQVAQIENMITRGVKVLVIAAIDNQSLTNVLAKAADEGIYVIAYDRLIMNTENVDYYATFDNFGVGVLMGQGIVDGLDLENEAGPFNVELFAGSPDDNNTFFFFNGAMSILQPYIDSGKLVVRSGQTGVTQVATLRWDGQVAQSRMENLITSYYSGGEIVHAVLSPYDGLSIGIISALRSNGYGLGSSDTPMPYITGQDAEQASVQQIINGYQSSTVFKDTRTLAGVAVQMANALLTDGEVEVNDTDTYNNDVKDVPSYLLIPVFVDLTNWRAALLDTGYYVESDFNIPSN
ncbi:multiple monosaccharide ABC transporter substrate-binding protein [Liberiplasma polymorphum]|uniref:multiple monosaccharide ABC transporter substrate-binding protein n=1 Tax=Liberiplasma polymorphum TaxID=3374570 RepID=UPI003774D472